jgi:cytochrome b6-f complex iron-sulfur subunit
MKKRILISGLFFLGFCFISQNFLAWGNETLRRREEPQIVIGELKDFAPGTIKVFADHQLIVFSDPEGIYAISSVCTHAGCHVSYKNKEGILFCPCHGSKFSKEGSVLHGPAKKALPWYSVKLGDHKQLIVDKNEIVPAGTKYKF